MFKQKHRILLSAAITSCTRLKTDPTSYIIAGGHLAADVITSGGASDTEKAFSGKTQTIGNKGGKHLVGGTN